eukprot:GHVR01032705.1.p1 GENE.GHVR01032705.1~~GHVR01032705.1.p1  ORF type:complete len:142 (+),score=16.93 GHVR01032705.1:302-727(+)
MDQPQRSEKHWNLSVNNPSAWFNFGMNEEQFKEFIYGQVEFRYRTKQFQQIPTFSGIAQMSNQDASTSWSHDATFQPLLECAPGDLPVAVDFSQPQQSNSQGRCGGLGRDEIELNELALSCLTEHRKRKKIKKLRLDTSNV